MFAVSNGSMSNILVVNARSFQWFLVPNATYCIPNIGGFVINDDDLSVMLTMSSFLLDPMPWLHVNISFLRKHNVNICHKYCNVAAIT